MKLNLEESCRFEASPEEIWKYLDNPELWPDFVAKLDRLKSIEDSVYYFDHVKGVVAAKVIHSVPQRELVLELNVEGNSMNVSYELNSWDGGCTVTEIVAFDVPFPFNWIIKWIDKFGYSVGPTNLQKLKSLVESSKQPEIKR